MKNNQPLPIKFIPRSRNWGDYIATYLYKSLNGNWPKTIHIEKQSDREHYLTVGSVLRMADNNSTVWGSGFINETDGLGILSWRKTNSECLAQPKKILAVRGHKTKAKLESMGVECPSVFGDPALLFPRFYQPEFKKTYKIGIIPHYVDKDSPVIKRLAKMDGVKIIDVLMSRFEQFTPGSQKYLRFIDDIASCEKIVSGSLHGLITSDAYGVPATWAEIDNHKIVDNFKYFDYFSSVNRPEADPIQLTLDSTIQSIEKSFSNYDFKFDAEPLLESCPFRR